MTVLSRRTVLSGAVATTATTAVGPISTTLPALAADAETPMALFIGLSSALTGIAENKLSPQRKPSLPRDPLNVKQAYFDQASSHPAFDLLLKTYKSNQSNPDKNALAKIILNQPEIRYLARSIMLAWYLGAWYEPEHSGASAGGSTAASIQGHFTGGLHPRPSLARRSGSSHGLQRVGVWLLVEEAGPRTW